ncbi:MAG: glycosyl transferase family 2 [Acidobacteria bacterium]|nr:glycosyl transferase family 2 [Acidobacteriota bacterium]
MNLHFVLRILEAVLLIPVVVGSAYAILTSLVIIRFRTRSKTSKRQFPVHWPPVTILKPVHGLEKNLRENLRSACLQDYPEYQLVISVQRRDDPAIPLIKEIEKEFGSEKVTIAIEDCSRGTNGKINNLIGGLKHARHEILVISDSDVLLRPDYLKTIVAPLADPQVGFVCTLYKAVGARSWYEKIEMLTLNADLMTNIIFAHVTGTARFCLGATTALRRSTLEEIGGLPALADYLVEDFEMGRRILALGKKDAILPYFIDTIMDLRSPSHWWGHQVYWDQNNRAAMPFGFFATLILRSIPFALLYAALRLGDPVGLAILAGALLVRTGTAAINLRWGLRDREGPRCLYLLPLRDAAALVSFVLAYTKKTTVWRGAHFTVTRDGRLLAEQGRT